MEKSPFIEKLDSLQVNKLVQNIPEELKDLKQWVCFDLVIESLNSKPKKIPKNPHNGINASHSDPKTWGSFSEALESCKRHNYPHIGFAFTKNDPYTGIDLDNCISDVGELNDFAKKILERFQNTYIEYSLSKKGLHIIIKGEICKGRKNSEKGIEIYSSLRFFVMTGDILQNHPIADMQTQLENTYNEFFCPQNKPPFNEAKALHLSDQAILTKAFQAKNGAKFQSLFNGELGSYEQDQSSADLAFCCLLSFWTKDRNQIDRIFRQSRLFREKWNRVDYRNATIDKALNAVVNGYKHNSLLEASNPLYFQKDEEAHYNTNPIEKTQRAPIKKFEFVPVGQMIQEPPKANWLIKKYMDKGALVVLFGDPGCMKSFLVIDVGLSIATNQEWHGNHIAKQGPVLYIAGEGFEGISRRLFAWSIFHKMDLSRVQFFVSTTAAQFLDEKSAIEVENAVNDIYVKHGPPALVIVDTLNRNYGPGDENSGQDMTIFINKMFGLINIYGCTVLVVHHSGTVAKDRARGSCVLRGAADWEYGLKKDKDRIILTSTKTKDYAPPASLTFNHKIIELEGWHDDDGEIMTSCVLQSDNKVSVQKVKPLNGSAKKALESLTNLIQESKIEKISIKEWREIAYHSGISSSENPDTRKKAFQRAREELCDLGYIEIDSEYCWLKRDTGQVGTNVGHVPFSKEGQTGHVSLDMCPDVPIG